MDVLSSVDIERLLVGFECDSVLHFSAKHHDWAVHEVVHHVFERDLICLQINEIEEDLLLSDDLNPLVTFNEEDIATFLDGVVELPFPLAGELVKLKLKEENLRRGSRYQCRVIDQKHLAQIFVENVLERTRVLKLIVDLEVLFAFDIKDWDSEWLALSIEGIDLVILHVVEGLYGEILWAALDINDHVLRHFSGWNRPEKVMVLNVFVVEQIHENEIVSYKTASYEGIGEIVNRHRVVVQT